MKTIDMATRLKMTSVLLLIALTISAQDRQKKAREAGNPTPSVEPSEIPQYVVDIDSNFYKVVEIGNQVWMAENLKTTRLKDGTKIPFVPKDKQWLGLKTPALCWYNDGPFLNDSARYVSTYGFLYNWYAVNTSKLCPDGWHVPSASEWEELHDFLGINAGAKMKETGTFHWNSTSLEVTNESGFTALPSGYRNRIRGKPGFTHYVMVSDLATFWSASQVNNEISVSFSIFAPILLYHGGRPYSRGHWLLRRNNTIYKTSGQTVRCIKN